MAKIAPLMLNIQYSVVQSVSTARQYFHNITKNMLAKLHAQQKCHLNYNIP